MNTIQMKNNSECNYLPILSMVSVSLLIAAMIFTYRMIEVGPFLTPGGVIPFAATYVMAGVIAEIYGYANAKKIIWGNFLCIFIFNITINYLLKIPTPSYSVNNASYNIIFNHSLYIMIMYSIGFLVGDRINAFCISKWRILTKGKYFIIRLFGSSIIGQISFSIVVIPMLYGAEFDAFTFIRQFTTTILAKMIVIAFLSYPSFILVKFLKRVEKINLNESQVIFNPFSK